MKVTPVILKSDATLNYDYILSHKGVYICNEDWIVGKFITIFLTDKLVTLFLDESLGELQVARERAWKNSKFFKSEEDLILRFSNKD